MSKINTIITPVLAAGSTASPYFYQVNISTKLCTCSCAEQTPVFNPTFSLVNVANVGTGQYMATIHVEGVISYIPCNGTTCCTKSQVISQSFSLPIANATAPTSVSIASGTTVNSIVVNACKSCGRNFVSETPLTITVV